MKLHPQRLFTAFALAVAAALVPAQERILTPLKRSHFDASFSPDGVWAAYQSAGALYVRGVSGSGAETKVYDAKQPVDYLWQANSAQLLVLASDRLLQVSRDGQTVRTLANLAQKSFSGFAGLDPQEQWVYGMRRQGTQGMVSRVRLSDGRLEDIVTTVPNPSSLDIDPSGTKLLITSTVFISIYDFYTADIDGQNARSVSSQPLSSLAAHGRWLDAGKNFTFLHVAVIGSQGTGQQLWTMDAASGSKRLLTYLPHQRKGTPDVSKDGKWIATFDHRPLTGDARALLMPADGGGALVLSQALFFMGDRIEVAPDGRSVMYVGADTQADLPVVRIYELDRPLRLAPTARPGSQGQTILPLAPNEVGAVFLGFGMSAKGLSLPGMKGTFDLDLTQPVLLLYAAGQQDLTGPFLVPNDTSFVGQSVYVQGVRLLIGQGLRGDFPPVAAVDIAPI